MPRRATRPFPRVVSNPSRDGSLTGSLLAAAACAALIALLAAGSARSATFVFQSNFFQFGATGPASGTLVTADGTGGPGDELALADIVFFEFSHTFAPGTTIQFETDDLGSLTPIGSVFVSADGSGLASGGWNAVNDDGRRMRHINNAGDVNDNYLIDSSSSGADGAFGGAFGGWVLVPEPSSLLLVAAGLAVLGVRRRG